MLSGFFVAAMNRGLKILAAFLPPAGAALFLSLAFVCGRSYAPPFLPAGEIRPFKDSSLSDVLFLSLGMRRLAAEIWFIRLMQYYGTSEHPEEEGEGRGHHHHEADYGSGAYPDFFQRSRHILDLDPYFTHACLYSAGALAFNLGHPDEAVELIRRVKGYVPGEWKYDAYLAAIGYSKAKNPGMVADILTPVVKDPQCPVMVKQLVAFLNKRAGRYREAAEIYRDIMLNSKDPGYIPNARRELEKLKLLLD